MKYQSVKGTVDLLPAETEYISYLRENIKSTFLRYGYRMIDLPVLENAEVFLRGLGQETDIAGKQLFRISGREGICLRPEGTAQVVRSCVQHNNFETAGRTNKLFYIGAMFRGERPQKGRQRQFHQAGAEAIGGRSPALDAEIIKLAYDILISCGLQPEKDFLLEINTLGSFSDKKKFEIYLRESYRPIKDRLCDLCSDRYDKNILRLLDCKNPGCRELAENINLDNSWLSKESADYYSEVLSYMDKLDIKGYRSDPALVRGLDYYTDTVFEFTTGHLGAQSAVCAGGRYDGLVGELGGKPAPCCGFALGLERLMLMPINKPQEKTLKVLVAYAQESNFEHAYLLLNTLRENEIEADIDYSCASLKSQLKYSQKRNVENVLIAGDEEIRKGIYILRNMKESSQEELTLEKIINKLR